MMRGERNYERIWQIINIYGQPLLWLPLFIIRVNNSAIFIEKILYKIISSSHRRLATGLIIADVKKLK